MYSEQYLQQEAKPMLGNLFAGYKIEKPKSIRAELIDEAFEKVNALRGTYSVTPIGRIGMMVGTICPKEASESFIHDIQKECQIAKNYRARFWQFYNEAK